MGRLIDADIALGRFIEEAEASEKGCIHINTIKRLLQDIDTAYDVEKVVAELEEEKFDMDNCRYDVDLNTTIDMAISVVKRGGV